MFPGANTSKGFYSYYRYIINQEEANRIFILKGGPGVGKSTFMKNISETVAEQGYDVEHMHCSSDNSSLDAIVVPGIGVALMDGTAPHVVDPQYPGVVDEIINLGDFWDETAMRNNKQKVINIKNEIGGCFERAYRYLKAAAHIYENNAAIYGCASNEAKVNIKTKELIDEIFDAIPPAKKAGRQRCMFASAITPDGLINYLDELMTADNVYILAGFPGAGTERVLENIKTSALIRGLGAEAFYCAFDPCKLEHLIIPGLNTALTTVNDYHTTDVCALRKIDFKDMLNERQLRKAKNETEYNKTMFENLLYKAVDMIHNAKTLHDELEACYVPYMDFDAIQSRRRQLLQRILGYAGNKYRSMPPKI